MDLNVLVIVIGVQSLLIGYRGNYCSVLVLRNFPYRSVLVSKATHVPVSGPSDEGPAEKGITSLQRIRTHFSGPKLTFPQDYSAWNLSNQDLGMCIPVDHCDNQTTETYRVCINWRLGLNKEQFWLLPNSHLILTLSLKPTALKLQLILKHV